MIYDLPAITMLAQQCAPEIAAEAIVPVIVTESSGNSLQINVNKGPRVRVASVVEGAAIVRQYIAAGYTVDVGLAQINSANFARMGISVEQAFDPCTNLRLASFILQEGYGLASRHYAGIDAISATYSVYNTGTLTRGFRNGYVNRVWTAAYALGSIATAPPLPASDAALRGRAPEPGTRPVERDSWVVGQAASDVIEVLK